MKGIFTVNPLLDGKERYIYGTGIDSLRFFTIALQHDLYINGFISSDNEKRSSLMNKPVCKIQDLTDKKENIVILLSDEKLFEDVVALEKYGFYTFYDYNFFCYKNDTVIIGEGVDC